MPFNNLQDNFEVICNLTVSSLLRRYQSSLELCHCLVLFQFGVSVDLTNSEGSERINRCNMPEGVAASMLVFSKAVGLKHQNLYVLTTALNLLLIDRSILTPSEFFSTSFEG